MSLDVIHAFGFTLELSISKGMRAFLSWRPLILLWHCFLAKDIQDEIQNCAGIWMMTMIFSHNPSMDDDDNHYDNHLGNILMMIINFNNTCFNCTHFDHSLWLKVDHSSRFLVRPTHDWNLREFPWIKHHMTWDPRNSHGELVRNTCLWKGSINLFSCILVIPKFPRESVKNSSSYIRHST